MSRFDHVGLTVADLAAMTALVHATRSSSKVEFEFALDHVDFRGVMLRSRRRAAGSSCCTAPATAPACRPRTRSRPR